MMTIDDKWRKDYEGTAKTPFPVRIGVDEIATETQMCDGWTYFCLPERYVVDFTKDTQAILDGSRINAFHGKKFKKDLEAEYKKFLILIRGYSVKSPQVLSVNTLLSEGFKKEFCSFGQRLLKSSLLEAGVLTDIAFETISSFILPLFTLARVANGLGPNIAMKIEMDEHSSFNDLNTVVRQSNGNNIDANLILKAVYNGYAKKLFPKSPLLLENGITVMKDSKSKLVQAADVIGNFSMAYVFVKLGKVSKSKEAKAALFEEVFGDTMEGWDFSRLTLQDNDLIIEGDGDLKFRIGWDVTKVTDEE